MLGLGAKAHDVFDAGAGSATSPKTRGLTRSVRALMDRLYLPRPGLRKTITMRSPVLYPVLKVAQLHP